MVRCPECGTLFVNRARCDSISEVVLSLLTVYPFRCQLCTARFQMFRGRPTYGSKREYRRIPVCYPMTFEVKPVVAEEAIEGNGVVVDLSIRGCGFTSETALPGGVSLSLTLMPSESTEVIEIKHALVRHVRGHRVGVEFLQMTTQSQAEIRRIVEGRLARQPFQVAMN